MPVERLLDPTIGDSQKIEQLSAVEYRVWTIYLLAADDYGVLPFMVSKIQGADRWCSKQTRKTIQAALDRIVELKLVRKFTLDGDAFICSLEWQRYQNVRRPRRTHYPVPPEDVIAECDSKTQQLFRRPRDKDGIDGDGSSNGGGNAPPDSGGSSEIFPPTNGKVSACSRTDARASFSSRSSTSSSKSSRGSAEIDAPLDFWMRQLLSRYPPQSVTSGYATETAFVEQIQKDGRPPDVVFDDMLEHLDNQLRGYQWRVKRMIPRLERWLREGLWRQLHDEVPPTAIVSERTVQAMAAADAFVKGGSGVPH